MNNPYDILTPEYQQQAQAQQQEYQSDKMAIEMSITSKYLALGFTEEEIGYILTGNLPAKEDY